MVKIFKIVLNHQFKYQQKLFFYLLQNNKNCNETFFEHD